MTDLSGSVFFSRFAFPPNSLGYCGPSDTGLLKQVMVGGRSGLEEMTHIIPAFAGAWPYLELIAACANREPLDPGVVEAYWLGSSLLDQVDLLQMGNSLEDRFRQRAGWDWSAVSHALNAGGKPSHSFHVFCIYPWVGLLQSGIVEQPLEVLDQCRIRWGVVMGRAGDRLMVRSRPLAWDGAQLHLSPERVEPVRPPVDDGPLDVGDLVAMHWDYVCQKITPRQLNNLKHSHDRHLAMANQSRASLGRLIER